MNITRIYKSDSKGIKMVSNLLEQEGLEFDKSVEYTIAVMDGDIMAATGSFYKNTLRCLAVSADYTGEGLMNLIISELTAELFRRQIAHVFIYTKKEAAKKFLPLGFYEIVSVGGVVFLENRRSGFKDYLSSLGERKKGVNAAVVMNANPFTLGHRYLVEYALERCDCLHLFIVSEDVSAFPRNVREMLVKEGTNDLKNICYHPTDNYIVSSATFPSYFIQESDKVTKAHAALDSNIFAKIAEKLGITKRFVGEEPLSKATALYNETMQKELPQFNIDVEIIPRKTEEHLGVISASLVRKLIAEGNIGAAKALLPETSYGFLTSAEAKPIIDRLQNKA